MDQVQAFLDDGGATAESFFIDDEVPAAPEGSACVCVGGIFHFDVLLASPFTCTVRNKGKSKALKKWETNTNSAGKNSIRDVLVAGTKAYTAIADELDAEAEAEMDDEETGGDEGDPLDAMNDAAVQAAAEEARRKKQEMEDQIAKINAKFDITGLSKPTVDRILSDYENILKAKPVGWTAEPNGRNLSHWKVELKDFEKGTKLQKDMDEVKKRTGKAAIEMEMTFPKEYPYKPPFIRVIRPRFVQRTARITIGGSICTELLTDDGWKPIYEIESIIETIRQQITDPESKAQVDFGNTTDYTLSEAQEAFHRVAQYHKENGW